MGSAAVRYRVMSAGTESVVLVTQTVVQREDKAKKFI